jgi:hypothetical protein
MDYEENVLIVWNTIFVLFWTKVIKKWWGAGVVHKIILLVITKH